MVTRNNSITPQPALPDMVGGLGAPHGLRVELMTALPGPAATK
jgi:hypothetical protein